MSVLLLVWKYRNQVALVAAVLGLLGLYRANNAAKIAEGRALEKARVADSTLQAVKPTLLRTDTQVVHDVRTVTKQVTLTLIAHDTILRHLTDTIRVKEYIAATDSSLKACTSLANDCAAFRAAANTTIQALQQKLAVQPVAQPRSCTASSVAWGLIGGAAGFGVRAVVKVP